MKMLITMMFLASLSAQARGPVCAKIKCETPPSGCEWSMEVGKNKCISGCGELVCEVLECPPVPQCAVPAAGCQWQMVEDENGCEISCGQQVCGDPIQAE